jgi:glycosyltransferase 2 family protein
MRLLQMASPWGATATRALMASARLTITLAAAWYIFNQIDWVTLLELLARADPVQLVLAAALLVAQLVVMAWRWQIVIELLGGPIVSVGSLITALGRGMLLGQPLPSTIGGDAVRTLVLSPRVGFALAARSVICDRVLALAILVGLVVVTLPLFASLVESGRAFATLAAVSVGGLAIFIVVLVYPGLLSAVPKLGAHWTTLMNDLRCAFTSGARGFAALLLALATHIFGVLLIYQLARAIAAPISLLACLVIVPPTLLIASIPISLGGWGLREGALAAGFIMVGATSEAGVATSILFGLTGPLVGLLIEVATPLMRISALPSRDA